jgi:uncharacterized protein
MPESQSAEIASIPSLPGQGLVAGAAGQAALRTGQTLPGDRRYAIENGPSGFDPADPRYFPKIKFLMLMRNERLAALRSRYDDHSHVLAIQTVPRAVRRDLATAQGRTAIERFSRFIRKPPPAT